MSQKMQSNAPHIFSWTFKAKLQDNSVVDCTQVPWQTLNRIKDRIAVIGIFRDDTYYGTIELLSPDQRLIFVRRVQQDLNANMQPIGRKRIIWVIGWQTTIKGVNTKSVLKLYEDGAIVLTNDDRR